MFNDNVAEFAKCAKSWLDTFLKRLARVQADACGFWRIEWQARKSGLHVGKLFPHFHLLIWGLSQRMLGSRILWEDGRQVGEEEVWEAYVECPDNQLCWDLVLLLGTGVKTSDSQPIETYRATTSHRGEELVFQGKKRFVNRCLTLLEKLVIAEECSGRLAVNKDRARLMSFCDWASLAWYEVVGSNNRDHLAAGLRVERVKSWGGVMSYCAKYMAKADCHFLQHVEFGRSWGIFNRKCVPWAKMVELELDTEVGVRLRRVARHYLERRFGRRVKAPYGITLYCDVEKFRRLWEIPPPPPF
jgi:hypothetical protein